jgi:hypothetical protein
MVDDNMSKELDRYLTGGGSPNTNGEKWSWQAGRGFRQEQPASGEQPCPHSIGTACWANESKVPDCYISAKLGADEE